MYRSPIRISGLAEELRNSDAPARPVLLLARRKLEAEFELAGADTITVEGTTLNRQEVITLFDELGDAEKLRYHLAIYEDSALLQFLEEGATESNSRWTANDLYHTSGFLSFVSSHFADAVNALYRRLLTGKQSTTALYALAANPSLMLAADNDRAFRMVSRFFLDKKNALLHLVYEAKTTKKRISKKEVYAAMPVPELQVLNSLPDSYEELRYDIATTLNSLCVAFDKRGLPWQSLAAIKQASLIRLHDGELVTLIPANLKLVRGKQTLFGRTYTGSKSKSRWGGAIFIAIVVIRFVLSGISHNSGSNPDISHYKISKLSTGEPTYYAQVEALLSGLALEGMETTDEGRYQQIKLAPPGSAAESFKPLLAAAFEPPGFPVIRTVSPNSTEHKLVADNKSSWDIVCFYSTHEWAMLCRVVPAGQSATFLYSDSGMKFDFTAGRGWNKARLMTIMHPKKRAQVQPLHIHGWYAASPANIRDFLPADGESFFEPVGDITGNAAFRVTFSDTAGNALHVVKELTALSP